MNLRTTIILTALLAAGGLAWWLVPMVLTKPVSSDGAGSPSVLNEKLAKGNLKRIRVEAGDEPVELVKGASGDWALPGKWPTRKAEAEELVDLISGLHSRFAVIPLTADLNLKKYGLDRQSQHPVRVEVVADDKYVLDFGQEDTTKDDPDATKGEPDVTRSDPFAKPTYVRVNDKPEVVRLGPDLLPILKRPREFYQRRQLFPDVERFKFASIPPPTIPGMPPPPSDSGGPTAIPKFKAILLESSRGLVRIRRLVEPRVTDAFLVAKSEPRLLAEQWEVSEPSLAAAAIGGHAGYLAVIRELVPDRYCDRPDPERVKSLLAAIPELWAESFVQPRNPALLLGPLMAAPQVVSPAEGLLRATETLRLNEGYGSRDWLTWRTGLDKPKYTLRATLANGDPLTIFVGEVSQTKERPGQPPPMRPGMPPMPAMPIIEQYRYARLDGQDTFFEAKASAFTDLFPPPSTLRDEKLARFESNDVTKVEVKQPGGSIILTKEKDEKRGDKWRITQPIQAIGENQKVSELIQKLAELGATFPDVIDNPSPKDTGFDTAAGAAVTLHITEKIPGPGEEKTERQRTVVYTFGKHDTAAKKVNVRVTGRKRVNVVPEEALKLAERGPLAYRGLRILDFDTAAVAKIDVQREKEKITLQQTDSEWKLIAPVTAAVDKFKAGDLASELSRLEAIEYVNDAPKAEDLTKAGLDKPALITTVAFTDAAKPAHTLRIGKQREGKQDYFAMLDTGSIFALKKEIRDSLDKDSLTYRPNQLWTLTFNDISSVKITRAGASYELKKDGIVWKIVGPFDAKASFVQVQPILDALANPKLSGFHAHAAANPAELGFDKPPVQITFMALEKGKDDKDVTRERTLIIGKPVEGKPEVYAKLADDPAVFKIAEATKLNSDKPALDLLDRRLLIIDGRQITKIQRAGAAAMTASKDGKSWKIESGNVSFTADGPTIDGVLRTCEALSAEKFADYGATVDLTKYGLNPPSDTVTVTVEIEPGKTETHSVKLGKTEGNGRYALVDANPGVAVLPTIFARELTKTHLDFADRAMFNFDEGDLQSVKRTMKNNDLELAKKNTWKIVKPAEQSADEQSMEDWTKEFAKLRADRVAAYSPADLKPFGLDAPEATLTFVLPEKDGKPALHVLKVGAPVDAKSPKGERFAMVDGSKIVGVLNPNQAKKLLAPALFYRDRTLVRKLSDPDKVVMERGDRAGDKKVTFAKPAGTWKMTTPLETDAEHSDLEEFLNVLYKLRADELVAEKPTPDQLKEFGLDKPEITWKFLANDKEVLGLSIGKRDSTDQRCYAKLSNNDTIFLLDPPTTNRATAEYRKRSLLSGFDAGQVEALTIASDGGSFTLRKVAGTWSLDGKPDAKLNADAVNETLGALANLKAERFVRDKDAPLEVYGLGKPKRTLVAQTGMGMKQTISLGNPEGGSKRVYAALPGNTAVFLLSETDSAKLNRDANAFTGK